MQLQSLGSAWHRVEFSGRMKKVVRSLSLFLGNSPGWASRRTRVCLWIPSLPCTRATDVSSWNDYSNISRASTFSVFLVYSSKRHVVSSRVYLFLLFTLLQLLPFFSPSPPSRSPILASPQAKTHRVVCVHRLCTHGFWLISSPPFIPSPTSHLFSSCQFVLCI